MAHEHVSRRNFLGGISAGAAAALLTPRRGLAMALQRADAGVLRLVKVPVTSYARARLLDSFDLACGQVHDDALEMILWPGDAARLKGMGFEWEVVVDDLLALDRRANLNAPSVPVAKGVPGERTNYRAYDDFLADISDLATRFPDKARVVTMPNLSREGRQVVGLEIASSIARNDGRPVFYMDGIHHSWEWPAAEMPMMFAFDLLESYGSDSQVTNIVDNVRTFIFPIMNPDGYLTSRTAPTDTDPASRLAYWRKNKRSVTGVTLPVVQQNPDYYGIDPNRNYGFNWGGEGSSGSQTGETYRGDAPFSEPETQSVRHWVRSNSTIGLISNHTYGRLILRPWGFRVDEQPPDVGLLKEIGDAMAAINGYTSQTSLDLYVTTGTSPDWAYGSFGTIGYVFEHGTSFHASYTSSNQNNNIPAMYTNSRGAFLLLAQACADTANHGIITGRAVYPGGETAPGATVRITKEFEIPLWNLGDSNNPVSLPSIDESLDVAMAAGDDGSFNFHVNPSTQPLVAAVGGSEAYNLTITAPSGSYAAPVTVGRGETADLGAVTLA